MRIDLGAPRLLVWSCAAMLIAGCADENPNDPVTTTPPVTAKGGPPGPDAAGPRSNPKLKEIMVKIGKGPQALQGALGESLKASEPSWEAIQGKAHEYASLAGEMSQHEPVRGTKESWAKLTASFAEAAKELDQAAKSKDRAKTAGALDSLGSSCMGCHREHRMMGPPGGGPPGSRPGGMGGPPGAPGPGGPGGASTKPAGDPKAQ